jgi:hypothetical protein
MAFEDHFDDLDSLAAYVAMIFQVCSIAIEEKTESTGEEHGVDVFIRSSFDDETNTQFLQKLELLEAETGTGVQ